MLPSTSVAVFHATAALYSSSTSHTSGSYSSTLMTPGQILWRRQLTCVGRCVTAISRQAWTGAAGLRPWTPSNVGYSVLLSTTGLRGRGCGETTRSPKPHRRHERDDPSVPLTSSLARKDPRWLMAPFGNSSRTLMNLALLALNGSTSLTRRKSKRKLCVTSPVCSLLSWDGNRSNQVRPSLRATPSKDHRWSHCGSRTSLPK